MMAATATAKLRPSVIVDEHMDRLLSEDLQGFLGRFVRSAAGQTAAAGFGAFRAAWARDGMVRLLYARPAGVTHARFMAALYETCWAALARDGAPLAARAAALYAAHVLHATQLSDDAAPPARARVTPAIWARLQTLRADAQAAGAADVAAVFRAMRRADAFVFTFAEPSCNVAVDAADSSSSLSSSSAAQPPSEPQWKPGMDPAQFGPRDAPLEIVDVAGLCAAVAEYAEAKAAAGVDGEQTLRFFPVDISDRIAEQQQAYRESRQAILDAGPAAYTTVVGLLPPQPSAATDTTVAAAAVASAAAADEYEGEYGEDDEYDEDGDEEFDGDEWG